MVGAWLLVDAACETRSVNGDGFIRASLCLSQSPPTTLSRKDAPKVREQHAAIAPSALF